MTRRRYRASILPRLMRQYFILLLIQQEQDTYIIQDLSALSFPITLYPKPNLSYPQLFPQIIKSMFSFNSVLQSLNPSKLVSGITNNYNKLKDRMIPPLAITQIIPCIYHIDFPQRSNVSQLAQHIGESSYLIWNISEYPYQDDFASQLAQRNAKGKMQHLNFQYYCNLPFYELIQAIKDIQNALKDGNQKVYIHCQQGKVRSAAFLASYLFVTSSLGVQDISQAIHHINKKLGINLESKSINYKNQHTLFKNLVNYITDQNFINKKRLELHRMTINNAPRIKTKDAGNSTTELVQVQVVIEIRCGPDVVYRSIQKQTITSGESICIDFQKTKKKVSLGDEFLIIVKYLNKKQLYNVLRIQANTNFIFNHFARLHQHDIDLSGFCQPQKEITFIDLTFKQGSAFSKLSKINSQPQQKKVQSYDLLSGEGLDSNVTVPEQQFAWFQDQPQIDEHQLNTKIKQVMQSMTKKQQERDLDKESSSEDQDFQDYLGKLQSQIQ